MKQDSFVELLNNGNEEEIWKKDAGINNGLFQYLCGKLNKLNFSFIFLCQKRNKLNTRLTIGGKNGVYIKNNILDISYLWLV